MMQRKKPKLKEMLLKLQKKEMRAKKEKRKKKLPRRSQQRKKRNLRKTKRNQMSPNLRSMQIRSKLFQLLQMNLLISSQRISLFMLIMMISLSVRVDQLKKLMKSYKYSSKSTSLEIINSKTALSLTSSQEYST